MLDPSLDDPTRALLAELKRRQLAFLQARLASPRARLEWEENLEAVWEELSATLVGELVDGPRIAKAVDALLSADLVEHGLLPAIEASVLLASARLREDTRPLGGFVPPAGHEALTDLLETPGLVPARLIREVLLQDAVEEVLRDVLFSALEEFSQKVNPFVSEGGGLPSILKKLSPFGLGGMGKAFDSLRADFEKRLQPEIRRFLQGFSQSALKNFVRTTIEKQDGPKFIALRKELARWVLDQRLTDLVADAGDVRVEKAQAFARVVASHVLSLAETRAEIRAFVELAAAAHAKQTLREALAVYGVTARPDFAVLAEATWPLVSTVVASAPVQRWLASLVEEFFDGPGGEA